MRLVPFDHADLRPGEPLPVPLHDGSGRLLAAAGAVLREGDQFALLGGRSLYTDPRAASEWKRRVAAAMDAKLRQNALLKDVVAARPDVAAGARGLDTLPLALAWDEAVTELHGLLRAAAQSPGVDWPQRLLAHGRQARALLARRPDASLYLLVQRAGELAAQHCAHHAMLALAVCELAAPLFGWPDEAMSALASAALAMNVAVAHLHDQLAASDREPGAAMLAQLATHAEDGAALLERLGLDDRLALELVAGHHQVPAAGEALADLPYARQIAALLARVDLLCTAIARSARHEPTAPAQAMRAVCLGAGGTPDEIGSALLRALGIFPPGSFVELAGGEIGVVVARGRRANLPYVATLIGAGGMPLGVPALRDTTERRYAVKTAVAAARVRIRPPHERLIAMR